MSYKFKSYFVISYPIIICISKIIISYDVKSYVNLYKKCLFPSMTAMYKYGKHQASTCARHIPNRRRSHLHMANFTSLHILTHLHSLAHPANLPTTTTSTDTTTTTVSIDIPHPPPIQPFLSSIMILNLASSAVTFTSPFGAPAPLEDSSALKLSCSGTFSVGLGEARRPVLMEKLRKWVV